MWGQVFDSLTCSFFFCISFHICGQNAKITARQGVDHLSPRLRVLLSCVLDVWSLLPYTCAVPEYIVRINNFTKTNHISLLFEMRWHSFSRRHMRDTLHWLGKVANSFLLYVSITRSPQKVNAVSDSF